jgi:hypothetical protein
MNPLYTVLLIGFCFSNISSQSPCTLGMYDNFYPKADWAWSKDSGTSAPLLKHKSIKDCYIGINVEPWGYEVGNWELKESFKNFGTVKYRIIRVEIDSQLWCYTYIPSDTSSEQLNVYLEDSCIACLQAVEKIIKDKENIVKFNKSE